MSPSKKRKLVSSDAAAAGPSSFKGKGKAPVSEPNAAASESFSSEDEDEDDDDAVSLGDAEDDLEGLVGEVLNGEIAQTLVDEQGISHSAVEVLRNGFHPELVEDDRTADQCEDGAALAEAGDAEEVARWLIAPVSLETFMKHTWERKPLYVSRNNNKQYYDGLLSKKNIEDWLVQKQMKYGINVDVTTYKNGVRDTHNVNDDSSGGADPISGETGTADSATIWRRFDTEKASLRVLHPQRWRDPLWKVRGFPTQHVPPFAIAHTRPAKGSLRPEGRIPSSHCPDCLLIPIPHTRHDRLTLSFTHRRCSRASKRFGDAARGVTCI